MTFFNATMTAEIVALSGNVHCWQSRLLRDKFKCTARSLQSRRTRQSGWQAVVSRERFMTRLAVLLTVLIGAGVSTVSLCAQEADRAAPNFVILLADDLGYGDLGCFGSPSIKTPQLDRMAAEGMKFTGFYAQPVCAPSRAALLTGCYPIRVGMQSNPGREARLGLHPQEVTIAELLKGGGYATLCIGKWHQGH